MEADAYACDLLDLKNGSATGDATDELLLRNLAFRRAYWMLRGVYPSKIQHDDFVCLRAGGATALLLPTVAEVARHAPGGRAATAGDECELQRYVDGLRGNERAVRREVLLKWWDRYRCCAEDDGSRVPERLETLAREGDMRACHREIVLRYSQTASWLAPAEAVDLKDFFELSWSLVERHDLLQENLLTGMRTPMLARDAWKGRVAAEEAVRHCLLVDRDFARQLQGALLCIDESGGGGATQQVVDALAQAAGGIGLRIALVCRDGRQRPSHRDHCVEAWRMPSNAFRFALHLVPRACARFVYLPPADATGKEWLCGKAQEAAHSMAYVWSPACVRVPPADGWRRTYDRLLVAAREVSLGESSYTLLLAEDAADSSRWLRHPAMARTVWEAHLRHSCPMRRPAEVVDPKSHVLLYLQFVASYVLRNGPRLNELLNRPCSCDSPPPPYCMLVVDNRESALSVLAVVVSLACVRRPQDWRVVVACTAETAAFYRGAFPEAWRVEVRVLEE